MKSTTAAAVPSQFELIKFARDEEFLLFCSQDEFVDIALAVLGKFGGISGEVVAWKCKINGINAIFDEIEPPPEDAYDEGTLIALCAAPNSEATK